MTRVPRWKAGVIAGMAVLAAVWMGGCWLGASSQTFSASADIQQPFNNEVMGGFTVAWVVAALIMVACARLTWLLNSWLGARLFGLLAVIAAGAVVILALAATLQPVAQSLPIARPRPTSSSSTPHSAVWLSCWRVC
jgi:hypothetical protein